MLTTEQYLNLINQRGLAGKPLKRVYGNMVKQTDLFINAYGKLYANRGAMTPGVDGDTVDGFSLKKVEGLIQELKDRTFRWTPVRRTYRPKGNGKQRPLGIPTWKDKVVQEVIRVILEAYYEPQFSDMSHGFRPNRSCHTALGDIKYWRGTTWFIEGDIKGCFDNISHTKLVEILGRHIKDSSFLKLINAMLKAGYLEDWKYHQTYSGTPQGGICSPLLANIFLNELDQAVEALLPDYNRGKARKLNPAYTRIQSRLQNARKKGDLAKVRELIEQRKRTPSRAVHDPNYRRLKYARYADDFLLGFIGPKVEAVKIKQAIGEILTGLELEMNDDKTLITHAQTQSARFLGFEINRRISPERRGAASALYFKMPWDVIVKWRRRYTRKGKAHQRHNLIDNSDYEIIQNYQLELQGLYQYYKNAHNVGKAVNNIRWYMLQSLVKTLATKHRTKATTIYKRYKTRGRYRKDCISITQDGKTATFGDISIHRKVIWDGSVDDTIPMGWIYYGRNEVVRRLTAGKCEIPGCDYVGNVEGHHIRALKDLEQKYGKTKERPRWVEVMLGKRRKSLMVCPDHHRMIHAGKYDGPKLSNLATS